MILSILNVGVIWPTNLAFSAESKSAQKPPEKIQKRIHGKRVYPPLTIGTKGNELSFDPAQLTVQANQKVQVIFTNNASPDSEMTHNWVLVKPGTDNSVAMAGTQAGVSKGYIPDSADIIAHSSIVQPGKSETIEFTAPANPGEYPFICTTPGHYPSLKGILTVTR